MDITFTIKNVNDTARFEIKVFDKLNSALFDDIYLGRFIPPSSNVDSSSRNSLLAGQLSRFATINSTPETFADCVAQCIARLIMKGYRRGNLLSKFKRSLRNFPFLFAATPAEGRDVFKLTLRALPAALRLVMAREARTTGFSR
jgi:hypothetical protein